MSVNAWLREAYNRNVAVGSLCTGAHVLAQAGLLNGKRCAIHWENLPGFSETFPQAEVYADLYEVDGNLYTCAGGTASLDMMLITTTDGLLVAGNPAWEKAFGPVPADGTFKHFLFG